jgi:hypothetical protein
VVHYAGLCSLTKDGDIMVSNYTPLIVTMVACFVASIFFLIAGIREHYSDSLKWAYIITGVVSTTIFAILGSALIYQG